MQRALFTVEELNPIPATGWIPPKEFPRLEHASAIAIDLETYDPNLLVKGPGWGRGDGHIVGVAVGVPTGERWYFPIRHTVGGGNFDPSMVLKWCTRELGRERQPKIGANLEYDLGWLAEEGVTVRGPLIDVQYAEPLLDEHRLSYSLDSLAETHLGEHKVDEALYDWLHRAYGGPKGRKQAANIYRAPVALAGPYAEGDVDLPLRIWERQRPLLEQQGLLELFELECALIPILVEMRRRGVPVNEAAFDPTVEEMMGNKIAAEKAIRRLVGFEVNPNDKDTLVNAFDKLGLSYRRTAKGNPSFTKDFLEQHPHDIAKHIREIRRWEKALQYVEAYRDRFAVNGVIHPSYHPLRSEEGGGTIVGRFSSSMPNLTNVSTRDPEMKRLVRGLFRPFPGERWRSRDFSQIQFRIMVHYAMGPGADEARQRYLDDPNTDYHDMALEMTAPVAGWDIGTPEKFASWRKPVKNINFALAFTGGVPTLMKQLGKPKHEVEELLNQYHDALPFLKYTSGRMDTVAQQRGYIRGILGRRHRFPLWQPKCWALRDFVVPHPDKDNVARQVEKLVRNPPPGVSGRVFGGVQRAYTHLSMNRAAQDGEGSTIKKSMVECYKAGIYDVIGYPLGTVHDEVLHSDPMTKEAEEAFAEQKRIMETCVPWKVPMIVGDEVGDNWGALKPMK